MLDIQNAVAVITGGASGIGECCAKYWVHNGGKVVLADMAEDRLGQVEQEIKDMGGQVVSQVCNVTSESDAAELAQLAISEFGSINLVLPFAGIIKDGMMISPDKETGKVSRKMSLDDFWRALSQRSPGWGCILHPRGAQAGGERITINFRRFSA
ncbi:MAG: SDR family NAD(P)-dependent oxidoreductase [Desulfovermiculus sp.]|nr:SDR family NAD(P)-dependent oxidoreductase [Desulfovermiculus sp.]